jgi:2-phospho-L-lactate/phosphoenolpyruvate guanylyltransferase
MPCDPEPREVGVVLPLRSFSHGKARLEARLGRARRETLVREMADKVVLAARPMPVVVVTSASEVVAWAAAHDVQCIDDPGSLDAAASAGRDHLRAQGCTRVVVAHGDLPFARSLAGVAGDGDGPVVAIVPSHRDDGTPVIAVPAAAPFEFSYGRGSFTRHTVHARALGLEVRVVRDPDLEFDVDEPDDLARLDLAALFDEPAHCQ